MNLTYSPIKDKGNEYLMYLKEGFKEFNNNINVENIVMQAKIIYKELTIQKGSTKS